MRVVMLGTGLFAEPTFEALLQRPGLVVGLFTQPDRDAGVERGSTRQTGRGMKTIAQEKSLPVFQPESINSPEGIAMLKSLSPDLAVVAAYGQIFKEDALAAVPMGFINVHASILPKYRGAAPINWAIYHGETRTGVTIFRIQRGVDTGRVLALGEVEIGPEETAGDVEARLAPLGAKLALEVVDRLAAGESLPGTAQDDSQATKAPKLKKENGDLDWSRTAHQVCCQVRAMHPWPTAYTHWLRDGQQPVRLIVHKAVARAAKEGESAAPGEILQSSTETLAVGAGGGAVVEILELQPAGKKRMPAADFLRGRRPQPGDRLGRVEP
jgi:methionyl-tRNA formyltransferase